MANLKLVKARVPHNCNKCGTLIKKGERYWRWTDNTLHLHSVCEKHGEPRLSETASGPIKRRYHETLESLEQILNDYTGILLAEASMTHTHKAAQDLYTLVTHLRNSIPGVQAIADEIVETYETHADKVYNQFGETTHVIYCRNQAQKIAEWICALDELIEYCDETIKMLDFQKTNVNRDQVVTFLTTAKRFIEGEQFNEAESSEPWLRDGD